MNDEEPSVHREGGLPFHPDLGPRLLPTLKTHTPWPVDRQMPTAYCLREHDLGEAHGDPPEGRALPLTHDCSAPIQVCGDCGVYWPCPEELQQRMDTDPNGRGES